MADEKAVIYESGEEAQYDATAKLLFSQKPFLANIVVRTVKEFMGMDPTVVNLSPEALIYHGFRALFLYKKMKYFIKIT